MRKPFFFKWMESTNSVIRMTWCANEGISKQMLGAQLGQPPPPVFGRTINLISTRGADYAHHSATSPFGFSDFATALNDEYLSPNLFISWPVHTAPDFKEEEKIISIQHVIWTCTYCSTCNLREIVEITIITYKTLVI